MWHPIKHYKTIRHHKMLVMKNCFRCGLYWQGLTHDLSKLAPVEFWAGAKYWQGTCSPNNAQRQAEGYSAAWLHHKGRNKHHLEYWIDYAPDGDHAMAGMRMPARYVAEMVCDRIAASKNYKGDKYTDAAAWATLSVISTPVVDVSRVWKISAAARWLRVMYRLLRCSVTLQTFVPRLRDVVTTPCSSRNTSRFRSPYRRRF